MKHAFFVLALLGCNERGTFVQVPDDTATVTETTTETTTPDPVDEFLDGLAAADVTDTTTIRRLATGGSALYAWWAGAWVGLLADDDPACPTTEPEITGAQTFTGGCTDNQGRVWEGTAEIDVDGATYTAFGFTGPTGCGPTQRLIYEGSFDGLDTSIDGSFAIKLLIESSGPVDATCDETPFTWAADYSGSWVHGAVDANADGVPDSTTWSGSGRIGRTDVGGVDATTAGEVFDNVQCGSQSWSGTTTWAADGHVAVLTYDGETDCDPEADAELAVDGVPMGAVEGTGCATTGGPVPTALWLAWMPALLIGFRRPVPQSPTGK